MIRSARELIASTRIIPVITIHDEADAVPLARALVAGGLRTLEVTLRTDAALAAIAQIANQVPEAVIGAGTIRDGAQARDAAGAGARFLVSPGCTPALLDAAAQTSLPFLPGVATATDVLALTAAGIDTMKLFPAEAVGGTGLLRSFAGPFADVLFCPTGGIDAGNAGAYLALDNVGCVGGSWMLPAELVAARDWEAVQSSVARAAAL